MGDRYIITVICPTCETVNEDVYYAPTCDFVTHRCSGCGARIDLVKYTRISYRDASNVDLIEEITLSMEGVEMDRREAREKIEKLLVENVVEERVYQLRPWTCYTAKGKAGEQEYYLLGFTKVMHPDDWDPDEGVGLAKKKALAFCAKKIMLWFSAEYDCPQEVCPWDILVEKWVNGTLSRKWYAYAITEMKSRYGVVRFDSP